MGEVGSDIIKISHLLDTKNIELFTFDGVESFLKQKKIDKDLSSRFVAWMIRLELLPTGFVSACNSLMALFQTYSSLCNRHVNFNLNDPLKTLPINEAHVIKADITRSVHWFDVMASNLHLDVLNTQFVVLHAYRVLSVLTLSDPSYKYLQGHDRFLLVSYALCLCFTSEAGIDSTYAEAFSFFMAQKLIERANIAHLLENISDVTDTFAKIDQAVKHYRPDLAKNLFLTGNTAIHYAFRWRILFYADEYDVLPLMTLWDNIILHKHDLDDFLYRLAIAHVCLIPSIPPGYGVVEFIQNYRDWDPIKVVETANKVHYRPERRVTSNFYLKLFLYLAVFAFILYVSYQTFSPVDVTTSLPVKASNVEMSINSQNE